MLLNRFWMRRQQAPITQRFGQLQAESLPVDSGHGSLNHQISGPGHDQSLPSQTEISTLYIQDGIPHRSRLVERTTPRVVHTLPCDDGNVSNNIEMCSPYTHQALPDLNEYYIREAMDNAYQLNHNV